MDATAALDNVSVYDPAGNRTLKIDNGARTTYVYDNANRLITADDEATGVTTYTYDANGNQLTVEQPGGDVVTHTWDGENRLVAVEQPDGTLTTNIYDADGHRVERDDGVDVTRYVYDGNNLITETDDLGVTEAQYTLQPQAYGDLVSQHRDAVSSFYHFDAIGNTAELTDGSQTVTDEYRFTAWGKSQGSTGSTENPFTFKGQLGYHRDPELDADEAAYVLHHRILSALGRFQSEDPAEDDPNPYRYVRNNPVNGADPSGLDFWRYDEVRAPDGTQRYAVSFIDEGFFGRNRPEVFIGYTDRANGNDAPVSDVTRNGVTRTAEDVKWWVERSWAGKPTTSKEWGDWFVSDREAAPDYTERNQRGQTQPGNIGAAHDSSRSQIQSASLFGALVAIMARDIAVALGIQAGSGVAVRVFVRGGMLIVRAGEKTVRYTTDRIAALARRFGRSADDVDLGQLARELEGQFEAPRGARGPVSGREFDLSQAGGPIRNLGTGRIRITDRGIAVIEEHLARFGSDQANQVMIDRLRRIAKGELTPTQYDLNFYSHELREFVRYRRQGLRTGGGLDSDLWNNAHTATLEDYRLRELDELGNRVLYHPDAWPFLPK